MSATHGAPWVMMPIAEVLVGERHRRDMRDLDVLARSMAEVGLLHPIVIRTDGTLIAGERRLRAAALLGWTTIPATPIDFAEIARGEYAENVHRKAFTPSEMVAIAAAIEERERELAKQRMTLGKISTGLERGTTRDKVAAPLGVSGKTLEKARAVVEAADLNPQRCAPI